MSADYGPAAFTITYSFSDKHVTNPERAKNTGGWALLTSPAQLKWQKYFSDQEESFE